MSDDASVDCLSVAVPDSGTNTLTWAPLDSCLGSSLDADTRYTVKWTIGLEDYGNYLELDTVIQVEYALATGCAVDSISFSAAAATAPITLTIGLRSPDSVSFSTNIIHTHGGCDATCSMFINYDQIEQDDGATGFPAEYLTPGGHTDGGSGFLRNADTEDLQQEVLIEFP